MDKIVGIIFDYLKAEFPASENIENKRLQIEYQCRLILPGLLGTLAKLA